MADVDGTPPRLKTVKRIRYEQKFKPEYRSQLKFISKSRAGETYAFCTLCRSDICIAHGERDNIKNTLLQKLQIDLSFVLSVRSV